MKILWIAPRWLEPLNDGARIASYELLRHLQNEKDLRISLLAIVPEGEETPPIPGLRLHEIGVLRRRLPTASPAIRFLRNPLMPVTFSSFSDPSLRQALEAAVARESWDWVIFDGMHGAIPLLPGLRARVAYRAHNAEFAIWDRAGSVAGFPKKQALQFQARLVERFELELIRRSELVLPVSDEDVAIFRKRLPALNAEVIRIGQSFPSAPPAKPIAKSPPAGGSSSGGAGVGAGAGVVLGFIGRLDWMPNRHGLDWFLREVWPAVSTAPGLRLRIAGSGDGSWLERYRQLPGIEFLGRVPSVEGFYDGIDAAIVPLFVGSGTRVKVIESSRFAVPCVSTALGVEGCPLVPGSSYLRAESAREWVAALRSLRAPELEAIGAGAFGVMKALYDSASIAALFASRLRGGGSGPGSR